MSEETELTEMTELMKLVGCSSRNKGRNQLSSVFKLIEEVIEDAHAIEIVIDCALVNILSKYK